MPNRTLKPSFILTLILPAIMMILLLSGCGTDHTSIVGSSESITSDSEFRYPEITPEQLEAGPMPGYRFLTANSRGRSTTDVHTSGPDMRGLSVVLCDELESSCRIRANQSGILSIPGLVIVTITQGDVTSNVTLSVVAPQGACVAMADFYPHPYQFSGPVEIAWNIASLGLPADFDYTTLVPFFVRDDGTYEELAYEWIGNHSILKATTNHFSRYIIGQKITSGTTGM
jgi:hypothetical protein